MNSRLHFVLKIFLAIFINIFLSSSIFTMESSGMEGSSSGLSYENNENFEGNNSLADYENMRKDCGEGEDGVAGSSKSMKPNSYETVLINKTNKALFVSVDDWDEPHMVFENQEYELTADERTFSINLSSRFDAYDNPIMDIAPSFSINGQLHVGSTYDVYLTNKTPNGQILFDTMSGMPILRMLFFERVPNGHAMHIVLIDRPVQASQV